MRWWLIPIAVLGLTASGHAQGWIDPIRPQPSFGVHKLRTSVTVHVAGRVATVEVEELFRNDGPPFGEGDYLYPLPGEAIFSNFSLYQGERELRGETMDAAKARSIYEAIVRRKRDPALIELVSHGLLRARVFPIASGETRKITLRYTQLLTRAGDALQFRYAAGSANASPRPMPVVMSDDVRRQRPVTAAPLTFTLIIDDARAFGAPFSPTHEVRVERMGNRVVVRPNAEISGDFDVFMPLARGAVGLTMVSYRPSEEPGFFMLTVSPGKVAERAVPRDITAVIDVSGSMSGEKIEQARAALHALLGTLAAGDRFRLIAFSDQVRSFRREWLTATRSNIDSAEDWIQTLQANGGTNIAGALQEAFVLGSPAERLPFVIFITDGLPSVGEENPERLAQRAQRSRGRTRVFAFGVGYDVNTYLLDALSAAARGSTQYVKPGEDVTRPIATLANRIRFPVLADLRIGDAPVTIAEIYPVELPDLFADEELIIVGRYHGAARGRISIRGSRAGRTELFSTDADFTAHQLGNEFISRIWAARKVGYLSQRLRLRGNDEETLQQLRETALRYGILSEYTSYLVQEPQLADLSGPVPPMVRREFSGQAAVGAAEAARAKREVKTAAAVQALVASDQAQNASADRRVVAGRSFRNVGGTWTDALHEKAAQDVVVIEPFSNAYFAVLRALPELASYWKVLPNVLVSGRRVSVQLASGGAKDLSAGRIADIVKRFRL